MSEDVGPWRPARRAAIRQGPIAGGTPAGGNAFETIEDTTMSDQWVKVAAVDDIAEGGTLAVEVARELVCLYKLGGRIYATDDICTHEEASLADGFVEGDCIECPLHQARFHIPTGEVRAPPATENLRVFPVRIDGEDVLVNVTPR
jgi:nitrite reductase/ring-hydroxylating ferredoxin subunit